MSDRKILLDIDEKPKIYTTLLLAFQHLFAMFGATTLVPLLINQAVMAQGFYVTVFPISVVLIASGVGTLIYIICTKGKSPMILSSSLVFATPIVSVVTYVLTQGRTLSEAIGATLTGIIGVGILYVIVGLIIGKIGTKWIKKLLPPVVTGPMIIMIGLTLATSTMSNIGMYDSGKINYKYIIVACITLLSIAYFILRGKGVIKIIPILLGMMCGYIASAFLGLLDFRDVFAAPWIELPKFNIPYISYTPNFLVVLSFIPVAFVTIAEHIGDHTSLGNMIDKNILEEPGLNKTMIGNGLATIISGLIGGTVETSYGENTAIVGLTRVASIWPIITTSILLVLFGFLGKLTALIQTIPYCVIGGMSILLYGFISVNGIKVLIANKVDLNNAKNMIIIATMLIVGLGGAIVNIGLGNGLILPLTGMTIALLIGIVLNLILVERKSN